MTGFKLPDDEFKQLTDLQDRWSALTRQYGELHYQKKVIESELSAIDASLEQLDADRFETISKLQEKYGAGQVNLVTQEFIPQISE
jgi:uncharacterized protein (DUF3084 family)